MSGRREAVMPRCPFCSAELQRPLELDTGTGERHPAGTCSCGAIYLADPTGKNVGTIMVHAMGMAADRLGRKLVDLVAGEDYEDAVLSYDWRTHRSIGPVTGYMDGYGRMYILKVLVRDTGGQCGDKGRHG